jgi:hypothetical protein
MLPHDVTRCGGLAPYSTGLCSRKNECARYLAPGGVRTPFVLSACEQGFIHAETVAEQSAADHPAEQSPERVLDANTLRTTCAAGGA